jgi:protein associated with RNAse G/E
MTNLDVIKLNYLGQETWRYTGKLIKKTRTLVVLEAYFDRDDTLVEELLLTRGDRFIEYYYNDRWYNIFEIHDQSESKIKCWYCNISQPAVFSTKTVTYLDLALDLLVYPSGKQVILDESEFEALPISPFERKQAQDSLHKLQQRFQNEQIIRGGWDGL